jgi:alanyl-tRNA synthetase
MQYAIQNVRSKVDFDIVGELPKKNIDTGMGMERVAFLKQGVDNMYEIDQVRPVLDRAVELSGKTYGADHGDDVRFRVIADHVRSSLMLMTDGVSPGNEGRGYILRRLLRRAIRSMRLLGVDAPSFAELFDASRHAMRDAYPEVEENWDRTSRLALGEEETFLSTLASGTTILDVAVADAKKAGSATLAGDTTFLLHDTFGFPVDLTLEIAEEAGLTVDRAAFDELMLEQRTRAKTDAKAKKGAIADLAVYSDLRAKGETVFTGYDALQTETTVLGILVDGNPVASASAGQIAEVILAESSLYAEAGGQAADQGSIVGDGFDLEVLDVQRPVKGLISHTVQVRSGEVSVDAAATSIVDPVYRHAAAQAHSATHLVHAALRQTLGSEAHQSGSFNKAGYMRLDFSWNQALSPDTRSEIEDIANGAVRDNLLTTTRIMSLDEAKAAGAMALFGEKYGDTVRMVDIGDGGWSRELCAGIHVRSSAEVGLVNLVSESSVGSTNRRVEALVGLDAFKDLAAERAIVGQLTSTLKTPREQLPERIQSLVEQLKAAEKKIAAFEAQKLSGRVPALVENATRLGAYRTVVEDLGDLASADELRSLATTVRERLGSDPAVVALAARVGDKPAVIVATNQGARDAGARAGALAKQAASALGGGGGGKDDLAQGGGTDVSAIAAALDGIRAALHS